MSAFVGPLVDAWAGEDLGRRRKVEDLLGSYRLLGKWAVNKNNGPVISELQVITVLTTQRRNAKRPCARSTAYLRRADMIALGLLAPVGPGLLRIRYLQGLEGPEEQMRGVTTHELPTAEGFAERREAARKAKLKAQREASKRYRDKAAARINGQRASLRCVRSPDKPCSKNNELSAGYSRVIAPVKRQSLGAQANTKHSASGAGSPAELESQRRVCARKRARDYAPIPAEEIAAVEAELLAAQAPPAGDELDATLAKWAARWGEATEAEVQASQPEPKPKPKPMAQPAPAERRYPTQRVEGRGVTRLQAHKTIVEQLNPDLGFDVGWLNAAAVANAGVSLGALQQAIALTHDAVRGSRHGDRGRARPRINNPGGYCLNAARKITFGWAS